MENSTNNSEKFNKLKSDLIQVLPLLSSFEQKVLTSRFGLNCEFSKTLEEVEKEFSITRVQIRQIEAKALRKIKKLQEERGEIKETKANSLVWQFKQKEIIKILNTLSPNERKIISKKYGLQTETEASTEDIGKNFNISIEDFYKIDKKIKTIMKILIK